jgi:hypothetical protein
MNLTDLASKHLTDKLEHGYLPHYQQHLPAQCRSLLEIGAAKGFSALLWQEFYPDCDIHLLDLFLDANHVSVKWCREHFFVPHQGDQGSLKVLAAIPDQFEVIIDDGSHRADHQLISFKHLFFNNLVSGGMYAIEDCHCNTLPFYWGDGAVTMFEYTALHMFKTLKETGELINPYFNEGETEIFKSLIDRIEIVENDKLILVWRKSG